MLSDRTEHKEDARCLMEKIGVLEKLHSGMSFNVHQCINSMMQPERRENVLTVSEASPEMEQGTSTGPDEAMKR